MKRFIAISLLLLIGLVTVAAASPPGLNSKPNVCVQIVAEKADLQAVFTADYDYVLLPTADARAGCTLYAVNYTAFNDQLQAEFIPIIIFSQASTLYRPENLDIIQGYRFSTLISTLNYKVCGRARSAVSVEISSDRYQKWQTQLVEVLRT